MTKIGNKLIKFNNWFFKGRIEKARTNDDRIENLSKEYDEGKILKLGN